MAITTTQQTSIMKASSALFNKAFSPEMVTGFVSFYESNGNDLAKLADALIGSSVYTAQYAGAATVAEYATILMGHYGLSYTGTTAADTNMKDFINYSFANKASWATSLQTIQAVDKYLTATFIPSLTTTDTVWGTMAQAVENKATVATNFKNNSANAGTELSLVSVTSDPATVTASTATATAGQTFTLTTGADTTFVSTDKSDTFNAYAVETFTGAKNTLTGVDALNGGAGKDILNVVTDNAIVAVNATVSNIEIINLEGSSTVAFDTTTYTGVETLNATKGSSATLTAAATTDVNVSGITGAIVVKGGNDVVVNDSKDGSAITVSNGVGTTGHATGTITVTDTDNSGAANAIIVDGGTDVTVTATADKSVSAAITVGANKSASEDVVVTQNLNSDGTAAVTGGAITVTGGKTVTVDVNSTNTATVSTAAITTGLITVTGDANTTTVTVNQAEAVAAVTAETAVAGVNEVASVKFVALALNETVILDGLKFTAAKALSAAEVAAAFANLKAGATHGDAKADNGIYSGKLATFSTGAVSTDTVVFTAVEASTASSLSNTGTSAGTEVVTTTTQGVTAEDAVTAVGAIANGKVVINGAIAGTDVLKTVTVDGYAASSSISSDVLADVTLVNSVSNATMAITTTVATLDLTLDNIVGTVSVDDGLATTLKALNLTTTAEASEVDLQAGTIETLTIAAGSDLDVSTNTLSAVKTVTITGTGDVALGDISATATALTSTGTGAVTATVAGTLATVTTGAGADDITVNTATITKAITLGAGNDYLDIADFTTLNSSTAIMDGGADTDTLYMDSKVASSVSSDTVFETKITSFEKLEISNVNSGDGALVINLENMDNIDYVITNGVDDHNVVVNDGEAPYAGLKEVAKVTVGGLIAGESTSVVHNGGTMTLTATAITESASVAFTALSTGQVLTIGGMTVTSAGGLATADQIAQTFATGVAALGDLTVTGSTGVSGYTNAWASGSTVVFTSTIGGTNVTDLSKSGTGSSSAAITVTNGSNGNLNAAQVAAALAAEATNGAAVISGIILGNYTGSATGNVVTYTAGSVGSLVNITATTTSGITPVVNVSTNGVDSDAGTAETAWVYFNDLAAGQSVTVAGRTVTATTALTAENVARAFNGDALLNGQTATFSGVLTGFTINNATWTEDGELQFIQTNANDNVDDITTSYSTSLEIKNLANNGTVEITDDGAITVTMKDASGSTDTLNLVLTDDATISAAGVETIKVTTDDLDENLNETNDLEIIDTTVLKTVTVTGADDLDLTTNSSALTTVDASAMTGSLEYTASVANLVVKGGSGDDELTASANAVTLNGNNGDDILEATADSAILNGGAGNDILISNDYATLTGGTGSDTFVVSTIFDKDSFATITDFSKTDVDSIQFKDADDFINTAVVTNNMDFEAALNKAIETAGASDITWFTFTNNSQTNTYLVYDQGTDGTSFDFAHDMVIKVTGTVDFSAASFNDSTDSVAFLNAISGNNI